MNCSSSPISFSNSEKEKALLRAFFGNTEAMTTGFSLLVIGILTLAALHGWMGGADWKVLVGLWGLWPLAGLFAMMGAGAWGARVMLAQQDRAARFPGVIAFAGGVWLALLVEIADHYLR